MQAALRASGSFASLQRSPSSPAPARPTQRPVMEGTIEIPPNRAPVNAAATLIGGPASAPAPVNSAEVFDLKRRPGGG
jgi:hypothetical protein